MLPIPPFVLSLLSLSPSLSLSQPRFSRARARPRSARSQMATRTRAAREFGKRSRQKIDEGSNVRPQAFVASGNQEEEGGDSDGDDNSVEVLNFTQEAPEQSQSFIEPNEKEKQTASVLAAQVKTKLVNDMLRYFILKGLAKVRASCRVRARWDIVLIRSRFVRVLAALRNFFLCPALSHYFLQFCFSLSSDIFTSTGAVFCTAPSPSLSRHGSIPSRGRRL